MKKLFFLFTFIGTYLTLAASEIVWSPLPERLSMLGSAVDEPQTVMDPNGNLVAVWLENGKVTARSKKFNMPWSPSQILSGNGAAGPCLSIDSNGNATAAWLEGGIVKVATKGILGTWSTPTSLSKTGASLPQCASSSSGNVVVVWTRKGNIEAATKLLGSTWKNPVVINAASPGSPYVAIGGIGDGERAAIVWEDVKNNAQVIYASIRAFPGDWSDKAIISDPTQNGANPRVSVSPSGVPTAIWYSYQQLGSSYVNVILQATSRLASGSWDSIATLSQAGLADPSTLSLQIAHDAFGNAIAVWNQSYNGNSYTIQSATKYISGVWGGFSRHTADNPYAYQVGISANGLGDAVAVSMFYNGASLLMQSSENDITGIAPSFWSLPITISSGSQNGYASIASALLGNALQTAAVWIQSNGVSQTIESSIGTKTLVAPPSNPMVTQGSQSLGVFTTYYNTISWTASPDPNTVGYAIFRNGIYVAQVDAASTQYVDGSQLQGGSVIYGIAAVDSDRSHSSIQTVQFP